MSRTRIICAQCGGAAMKEIGGVNRAIRKGAPLYCNRDCAGLARRTFASDADKRAAKAAYDRQYCERNPRCPVERAAYYQRTRDPAREAVRRKARMPQHIEYCRRPEYRRWKAQYDRQYRAGKEFGDFGEASIILNVLCSEIAARSTFNERAAEKGTLNKHQSRRRDYERQTQRR